MEGLLLLPALTRKILRCHLLLQGMNREIERGRQTVTRQSRRGTPSGDSGSETLVSRRVIWSA